MVRSVSEPYSPYDYVQQSAPYPAFDVWDALTYDEREALVSFQDLGSMQDAWDVEAPDAAHVNCSIINSYLRFDAFRELMSEQDVLQCERLIGCIDSAIAKSTMKQRITVIRGLADASWVDGLDVGSAYREMGYGSYSLSVDAAVRYAGVNAEKRQVFFARYLDVGAAGLYLGRKEEEIVVRRGTEYLVKEIEVVKKGLLSPLYDAIVYMLVEI